MTSSTYSNPFTGDPYTYGQVGPEWNWGFTNPLLPVPTQPGNPSGNPSPGTSSPGAGNGSGGNGDTGSHGGGDHAGSQPAHGSGSLSGSLGGLGFSGSGAPLIGSSSDTGPGQINLGKWGNIALGVAGMLPGVPGTIAGLAGLGIKGYNLGQVNAQMTNVGAPPLSFGQDLGAMLPFGAGNPYGSGAWGANGVIGMAGVDANGHPVAHPGNGLGAAPGDALGGYNGQGRSSAIGPIGQATGARQGMMGLGIGGGSPGNGGGGGGGGGNSGQGGGTGSNAGTGGAGNASGAGGREYAHGGLISGIAFV